MSRRDSAAYSYELLERIRYHIEHLDHEEHTARYLAAMGTSSEVDHGVSGTKAPDAQLFNHVRHPDAYAEACRRAKESAERALRRLHERLLDRNPAQEADQQQAS